MDEPEPGTPPVTAAEPASDPATASTPATTARRGQGRRQLLLFLGLLLCYGFFIQRPAWNEYSRYDLVRALVEQGSVRIDDFHENSGDVAFKDGHWYSDKAPGTAFLGVPVYAALVAVNGLAGREGPPDQVDAVAMLSLVVSGVSTALLVVLLVRFLVPVTGEPWALFIGVAYGLGTIAFPFATMFFGHALSTFALFAAFYLLHRWRRTGGRWEPVAAGFLGGWAVITEVPVVLGVAVLAAYAIWLGRSVVARFVLGGLPVALLFGVYNLVTFGSPTSLGYQYTTAFAAQNATGIVSIVWPSLVTFLDLLFSARGLITLAPWLVLAPLGLLAARTRAIRPEVLTAAAICVAILAYNSGALNPFGGWTPGPRYLVPMLPFAALLVAIAPRRIRPVTVLLVAYSIALMLVATVTRPNAQEIYADPLVQLWLPRLLSGHLANTIAWERWGLAGIQPLLLLLLGVGIAVAGILATRSRDRVSSAVALACAGVLGVLVVAFALPAPSPAPVFVASADPGAAAARVVVAAAGAYPVTTDKDRLVLWAQLENAGGTSEDTRIEFRIQGPDDAEPRAAWYSDIRWDPGKRDATELAMELKGADPSRVAWEVRVLDPETREVLATTGVRPVTIARP